MSFTVRAYNVLFGDAILISWKEADGIHHAWVDFGNFHNDSNTVFEAVYRDVLRITGGRLDLVVITHRHLDHLEGFYTLRKSFAQDFTVERLWVAHVKPQADRFFELVGRSLRRQLPLAVQAGHGEIGRIWRNNFGDRAIGTNDRMTAIRREFGVPANRIFAIHRGTRLTRGGALPSGMRKLDIEILAPERDSSVYLRSEAHALALRGLGLGAANGRRKGAAQPPDPFAHQAAVSFAKSELRGLADFARLRRQLRSGGLELLAAVDRTRNNTSIVMRWTHGGKSILLTGDAEEASWEQMKKNGANLAAQVIKVGHHGSVNASPTWSFKSVLPRVLPANACVVSTDRTRFTGENEVPKSTVLTGWRGRLHSSARLMRTDKKPLGKSVVVEL
jgi:hypothetical protein